MKLIPNAVTRKVGRELLKVQKNSPHLLFAVGMVGFVGTVVLSSRATLRVDAVLDKHDNALRDIEVLGERVYASGEGSYSEKDAHKDRLYVYGRTTGDLAKLYGPAVVCGVVTVAALTKSHHILTKRNVALTAAYAALEKGFNEYRARVDAALGTDRERELRYAVTEEKDGKTKTKVVNPQGASVYARFFDEFSRNWEKTPEYNRLFLKAQQNYANDLLQARGHVFLNEVYDELGLERSQAGAVVGWVISKDGDNYIDFGIFDRENEDARRFVNGLEGAILLDFNVDGVIYDKI